MRGREKEEEELEGIWKKTEEDIREGKGWGERCRRMTVQQMKIDLRHQGHPGTSSPGPREGQTDLQIRRETV